jgi:predicted HAD superfamily hydrolase
MKSFDYFDTLVTRLVAEPTDVFRLVEERSGIVGFSARRIAAEYAARQAAPQAEVTLDAVYRHLSLADDERSLAMSLELQLEQALAVPVRENVDRLQAGDLIVSDMYLPQRELQNVLAALRIPDTVELVVSSSEGVRKADGRLWDRLVARYPRLQLHVGDNLRSDVTEPRKRGLRSEHYTGCDLNRYEQALVDGSIDGSVVAAACRAARLGRPRHEASEEDRQLDEVFASVFAPLFTGFVDWVLDSCMKRGVRTVLFMARDGQLLYRLACERVRSRGLELVLRYVYGSRRALHLPGLSDLESAKSWLLENTPLLSLADVADRAELSRELMTEIAGQYGFDQIECNLSIKQRERLPALVSDARFVAAIRERSQERWSAANDYYLSVGLGTEPVAMVDVGWNGRMQASLRGILSKGSSLGTPIFGYYFSLTRKVRHSDLDALEGYSHDPGRDGGTNPWDGYRAMIEAALEADHGSTLRFEQHSGGVRPVLGEAPSDKALALVRRQQEVVLAFAQALGVAESAIGRRVLVDRRRTLANGLALLRRPNALEAAAFSARERAEGQVESRVESLVRRVPLSPRLFDRSELGYWPEGTVALSGHSWLMPMFALSRAARRLSRG